MSVTPKSSWPWVKTLLGTVFDQPDAESVHAQFDRVLDALEHKLPRSHEHLEAAREEILAFTAFPKSMVIWLATGMGGFWPIWPIAGIGVGVAFTGIRAFGPSSSGPSESQIQSEMRRLS